MSDLTRKPEDDIVDRDTVLAYVRQYPGQRVQEGQLKQATGVNKAIIRRLLRDVPGIDQQLLEQGEVRWTG